MPVRFLLVPGNDESSAIFPLQDALVSLPIAYKATMEFLSKPDLPASVRWLEL
jgi:hypothetical protein